MTRINCVPVSELSNKHLVAEYRELPRVVALVEKAIERGERPDLSVHIRWAQVMSGFSTLVSVGWGDVSTIYQRR